MNNGYLLIAYYDEHTTRPFMRVFGPFSTTEAARESARGLGFVMPEDVVFDRKYPANSGEIEKVALTVLEDPSLL